MGKRFELDPEKKEIFEKRKEQIIKTIEYAVKRDGRTKEEISLEAGLSGMAVAKIVGKRVEPSLRSLILIAEELSLEIVIQEKEEPSGTK